MKTFQAFLKVLIVVFTLLGFTSLFAIVFDGAYFNTTFKIDTNLASSFGDFFGGFVGTIFSVLGAILIIYTIVQQSIETKKNDVKNHFFKMVDYHNGNVSQISIPHIDVSKSHTNDGRRAFVIFKIQIKRLLEIVKSIDLSNKYSLSDAQIVDIAYIIFYYGLDDKWKGFVADKLKMYPNHQKLIDEVLKQINAKSDLKLGRTNQTNLSVYFRNMYNAIKLVDESPYFTKNEKKDILKIYRAQLSNPELYVLFFNLVSRFGKKWKDNGYVTKYELIKNLPHGYCDGYNPKEFFEMQYEDDEY